jgi:hypothetical protein
MKYFLASFGRDPALLEAAAERLASSLAAEGHDLGPPDDRTPDLPLVETRYYEREMGPGLVKRYQTFPRLAGPEILPALKLQAMALERDLSGPSGRTVNLDPGYVFDGGLVLATGKYSGHRLYLGSGVWGELTLHYHRGAFQAMAWTYRDYLGPEVAALLGRARRARAAALAGPAGEGKERATDD